MKKRLEKNNLLTRKILHISFGIFMILFYWFFSKEFVLGFNLLLFSFSLMFSQYLKKHEFPFFSWLVDNFSKEDEEPLMGFIYFLVGASLSIYFFEKQIALASISILSFGDSFSSIFGREGNLKLDMSDKNLEGIIIGMIVATLVSQFFVGLNTAFFGSFFGMFAEYIDLKTKFEMDDNIMICLVSGIAMNIHYILF